MSLAELQDRYGDFYAPRFRITVGGEEFTEASGVVADLSVDTTLDGADRFAFSLTHEYDPEFEGGTFLGLDWDLFSPGTEVVVEVGYEDRSRLVELLVGSISTVKTDFPASGVPTVGVSGYDLLHDLTTGGESASWDETTDSAVVKKVLERGSYGFEDPTPETVVETRTVHPKVTQEDDESDFEFLSRLAERNGFELFARGRTFYFRPPPTGEPTLTLAYGESLGSFSPERNAAEEVAEVEVRHWDPERGEEIVGVATDEQSDAGDDTVSSESRRVLRVPVRSREEAETVAAAALGKLSTGLITGSGETVGIPDLRVGESIRLEGLTVQFTNIYYLEQVTHRVGGSGYGTSFSVTERPQ